MIVSIRMARYGLVHRPCYKIVAIDARKRLRGRPLEYLGIFQPHETGEKRVRLNCKQVRHWLSMGARISRRVASILKELDSKSE